MMNQNDNFGPFVLIRELGSGSYGVVWLAERRTRSASIQVAIKIPKAGMADESAIIKEAKVWIQASGHPNVVFIIDIDVYYGCIAIVSEYLEEGDLSKYISKFPLRIPDIQSTIDIVKGILSGLSHLHTQNIVHRDLKPANILMQKGHPKIADFGIARNISGTTNSMKFGGSPAYMAPEAWRGERSALTDIWSIGIILYEMLYGSLPFKGNVDQVYYAICGTDKPATFPNSIPDELVSILRKALQKDSKYRYQTAFDMLSDLQSCNVNSIYQGSTIKQFTNKQYYYKHINIKNYISRKFILSVNISASIYSSIGMFIGYISTLKLSFIKNPEDFAGITTNFILAKIFPFTSLLSLLVALVPFSFIGANIISKYYRKRRGRSIWDRTFNIVENLGEAKTTIAVTFVNIFISFIIYIISNVLIILSVVPASIFVEAPSTPGHGILIFGCSGLVSGICIGLFYGLLDKIFNFNLMFEDLYCNIKEYLEKWDY